ncbi:MAG: hypothetical protein Q9221_000710 [Calogaya cf. arnoldii]
MEKKLRADTLTAYELIERSPFQRKPLPIHQESDDDLVKQTSRLPPKPLPGRHKYWPFLFATLIAILNVVVLAVFIANIQYLLPATDWDSSDIFLHGTSCDLINEHDSSRWQSTFQINLRGSARLSFAEAKLIDLLFDLIVGQGGRLLLAAVSYIVFMDALLRSMESSAVSYKLYASLVFESTSLIATWRASKAVFSTKGWRAKLYLTWCALAMIYVLAFPTLIESMTGYVSPSSPGFSLASGQFITLDSENLKSCFNVTAGQLFGLNENNTRVVGPPAHTFDAASSRDRPDSWSSSWGKDDAPGGVNSSSPFWAMATWINLDDQPIYHDNYTIRKSNNSFTTLSGEDIPPTYRFRNSHYNITINDIVYNFTNSRPDSYFDESYCYDDLTLRPYEMKESPSVCINKEYFVWGFSSIVLYVTLGLQLAWTLGMYCLWLDANLFSKLVKAGRTVRGPFRAATDLAEAMKETLGDEYCAYTDQEIGNELGRSGNMLRYNAAVVEDGDQLLHVGLTTRPGAKVTLRRQRLYGAEEKLYGTEEKLYGAEETLYGVEEQARRTRDDCEM